MDKTILNGSKLRVYGQGNSQSGSIQYTDSKLSIKGNSAGSGVLITDGKLYLKSGATTTSIIYDSTSDGVSFPDGIIYIGTGSSKGVIKYQYDTLNFYTNSRISGQLQIGSYLKVNGHSVFHDDVRILTTLNAGKLSVDGISSFYGTITASSGITTSALIASQDVTASGHVSASLFYGDGSQLTGIIQDHNDLTGLQPAGATQYYHLSQSVWSNLNAQNQILTNTASPTFAQITATIGFTSSAGYLQIGGKITSSGAKIGSGTGYVSSSTGVLSTKTGQQAMDDLGAYRTITINGTSNEVSVSPGAQDLSTNRTWTIGLPDNVTITNDLTIGNNVASDVFSSGFGGSGFAISQSNNRYIAQFDDLWVRGSLNVSSMVINQIRATNGSLWISDASKATSASYDSTNQRIVLRFQTGSLVPFIAGDILRSKRWGVSGSTTQSVWDISTTVSAVNYAQAYVTISAPTSGVGNLYTYTSSANGTWAQFVSKISNSGSQWVRVGNTTNGDRKGSIYITSNDFGGPFLDVYDGVSSSVQATSGASQSVDTTKVKTRVGKLSGIVDSVWGQLSGYGLYSDNVYLKGTISATAGTFSGLVSAATGSIGGWNITNDYLYKNYSSNTVEISSGSLYFLDSSMNAILIGTSSALTGFGIIAGQDFDANKGFLYTNFRVDQNGAYINGQVEAQSGFIGGSSGWVIDTNKITTSGIQLLAGTTPAIKIGNASAFNTGTGIFMSASAANTSYLRVGQITGAGKKYFLWDGSNLSWQTPNFTMSTAGIMTITGSVNATSGYFVGSVTANTGYIGGSPNGWQIKAGEITTSGIKLLSGTLPYIGIGASAYAQNGIWLGRGNYYSASFWNTSNARGLKWDGQKLIISASNFSLDTNGQISANQAVISGSISSSAGQIGGWSIGQNTLTQEGSIVLGSSSAIGADDIFIGSEDGSPYFQLGSKFKYTNSNIVMSGSISSSAGQIGGWTINSGGISSVHSYGTVSITRSGTSNLTLTDTYGNFIYSAANSHMFTNKTDLYQKTSASYVSTTQDYSSKIKITTANPNKGFGIEFTGWAEDSGTPFVVFTISGLAAGIQYVLQSKVINPIDTNNLQNISQLFFAITNNPDPDSTLVFSDTSNSLWKVNSFENEILKQYKFSTDTSGTFYLWLMGTMRAPNGLGTGNYPKFTFSGFRIDSFKQYTQLSQKGLLVFNTPQNYIQLTSQNNSTTNSSQASLGLLNVLQLYVNGLSVNQRMNNPLPVSLGGTGTSSFENKKFLWYNTSSGLIESSGVSSGGLGGGIEFNTTTPLTGGDVISRIVNTDNTMSIVTRNLSPGDILAQPALTKNNLTVSWPMYASATSKVIGNPVVITHSFAQGAIHLPVAGTAGQILVNSSLGSGSWSNVILTSANLGEKKFLWYDINNKITNSSFSDESFAPYDHAHTTYTTPAQVSSSFVELTGDTMTGDLNLTGHCITVSSLHGDGNNYIFASEDLYLWDVYQSGYISFEAFAPKMHGFVVNSCNIEYSAIYSSDIQYSTTTRARTVISNSTVGNTFTVSNTMVGQYNRFSSSTNITIHIQTQSTVANYKIDTGSVITLFQAGTGVLSVTKSANVTLNTYNNGNKTYGLYSSIQLINVSHNVWDLIGAV